MTAKIAFLFWCAIVLGGLSLFYGLFWLIDQFHEIPKDDDGN